MGRFQVDIPEVHVATWEVSADDEDEAIAKALNGDGDFAGAEYSHTMERWSNLSNGTPIDRYEVSELSGGDDGHDVFERAMRAKYPVINPQGGNG